MRIILLLPVLLLCSLRDQAQVVFCPPGAEWRSLFASPFSAATRNKSIVYTGDTTINSEQVKVLQHARFFPDGDVFGSFNPTYLKQHGDTVLLMNSRTMNQWQILYNFAAAA